jgi:transposase
MIPPAAVGCKPILLPCGIIMPPVKQPLEAMARRSPMEHTIIAVDLAKSVFQVAVSHRPGRVDDERRLSRERFLPFFAQQPPATVVLEAWGSAHHWARQLQPLGHVVRLLPAPDVRPYVRRNKTDRNRNEEIHAVPVKTVEHQTIESLHRLRSTWLATRTARLNTLRGLLREFGVFIPVGAQRVVPHVRELLEHPTPVPMALHPTLAAACDEITGLEATRSGDTDSHGTPRASRPCGRLRRCASRSLDPCSRRGLSTAMRRRQTFVAHSTGSAQNFALLDGFYLTEESRYCC